MKRIILKVLEKYQGTQINLDSEVARELLAEDIYRAVGNFFEFWGKKEDDDFDKYEEKNGTWVEKL
tara:strand:- start:13764 stop:13961 length:198 start_codon:yes stop_codon:yes gene_type:complete